MCLSTSTAPREAGGRLARLQSLEEGPRRWLATLQSLDLSKRERITEAVSGTDRNGSSDGPLVGGVTAGSLSFFHKKRHQLA